MRKPAATLRASLLLVGLLAACSSNSSSLQPPAATPTVAMAPTVTAAPLVPTQTSFAPNGPAQITVEGTDGSVFVPAVITVTTGQTVELNLVNNGKLPHTFSVPDLNLEVQMPSGQSNSVTFTAPAVGEYPFSSGVIEDLDTMKGVLVVIAGDKP